MARPAPLKTSSKAKSESQAPLVGRGQELREVLACLSAGRNVLLEGPVGVGKTQLALAVTEKLKRPVFRIDGDGRYSEQKLSGWFDPPAVVKRGYVKDAFFAGPLVQAMQEGGVLFINELNRLPEGVQNVLLPAIDERRLEVPRLGVVKADKGFLVIATQNPKEFVATSHLSEAILDRFELVVLDYQSFEEEVEIVQTRLTGSHRDILAAASVRLVRLTRTHPRVRRGASIRAALSISGIAEALLDEGASLEDAFVTAVKLALPTRLEMERDAEAEGSARQELERLLKDWAREALAGVRDGEKKKNLR